MFEVALYSPKTTNRAKFFIHVLHYLQGCNAGPKLANRIREMPVAKLRARGGVLDLVQVLSQMLIGWVSQAMNLYSMRLNGPDKAEPDHVELDTENTKREVNRFLGWAIWNIRRMLTKR